jgi:hypothetical protein
MDKKKIDIIDPLSYPLHQYPIALIDYLWVITIYSVSSFTLALIIDGYILPEYDAEKTQNTNSYILSIEIICQLAIQGFIAILLCALLQKIPSPVNGIMGYETHTVLGVLIRNPAIISVILFALSKSLQGRIFTLFGRFDKNVEKIKKG